MGIFNRNKTTDGQKELPQTKGFRLFSFLKGGGLSEEFYGQLEDLMVEGDAGVKTAVEVCEELRRRVKAGKTEDEAAARRLLREILRESLITGGGDLEDGRLNVGLILGVNGVGKTTTVAKMAHFYGKQIGNDRIVLAAGDTFRAAAAEQLERHGERLGVRLVRHEAGSDPGAVIYDAVESAKARKAALILADTAGRMHTKSHLVEELKKISKILESKGGDYRLRKFLVLDATTGQNSVSQAEVFNDAVGVDAVILTKTDSLSKGGNLFAICRRFGLPIAFTGTGERLDDFHPFDAELFLDRFLGE